MKLWLVLATGVAVSLCGCGSKYPAAEPGSPVAKQDIQKPIDDGQAPVPLTPEPQAPPAKNPVQTPESIPAPSNAPSVARQGTRRVEPTRPALPKPDETVKVAYEFEGNKIEVDGGCKISESSITCWKADGSDYPDLTEKIKNALNAQPEYSRSVPIRYGLKNRVIVFKTTQNSSSRGGSIHLMQVGKDQFGGMLHMNLSPNSQVNTTGIYERYEVRAVAADPSAKTTFARLIVNERLPEQPQIDCKVGASAKLNGVTYTISSIEPFRTPDNEMYAGTIRVPTWKVTFTTSGKSTRPMGINLTMTSADGQAINYVDKDGNPVDHLTYSKLQQEAYSSRDGKKMMQFQNQYRTAMSAPFSERNASISSQVVHTIGVNPEKLSKLTLNANFHKTVELAGIPMDPR